MGSDIFDECKRIIRDVGEGPILKLYDLLRKKKITVATLKKVIDKMEIDDLLKKVKSVTKIKDEKKISKGKVYRALKK